MARRKKLTFNQKATVAGFSVSVVSVGIALSSWLWPHNQKLPNSSGALPVQVAALERSLDAPRAMAPDVDGWVAEPVHSAPMAARRDRTGTDQLDRAEVAEARRETPSPPTVEAHAPQLRAYMIGTHSAMKDNRFLNGADAEVHIEGEFSGNIFEGATKASSLPTAEQKPPAETKARPD